MKAGPVFLGRCRDIRAPMVSWIVCERGPGEAACSAAKCGTLSEGGRRGNDWESFPGRGMGEIRRRRGRDSPAGLVIPVGTVLWAVDSHPLPPSPRAGALTGPSDLTGNEGSM
jgi:hypothetical protein